MPEEKRTRRSIPTSEKVEKIDKAIAYHQNCIEKLNEKKERLLHPKKAATMKDAANRIKELGLSYEEVIDMLNNSVKA